MRAGVQAALSISIFTFILLAAPVALAQEPGNPLEDPPPVQFEDQTIPGTIVPLDTPGQAAIPIGVGCDGLETPDTTTTATVTVATPPASATTTVSPAATSWVSEVGDCPSEDIVHEGETVLNVRFDETAPAFEPVTVNLEMMVEKTPPTNESPREHGPFEATVTATPGYLERYEVEIDEPIQEGVADETMTFTGSIENQANGETRFDVSIGQAPEGLEVDIEPAEIVLAPFEPGTFEVHVAYEDPGALEEPSAFDVTLDLVASSTHADGSEGSPSTLSFVAEFEPLDEGLLGIPTLGPFILTGVLGLVAMIARDRER